MLIENDLVNYCINSLKCEKKADKYQVSWKYRQAEYFLIVISNFLSDFSLEMELNFLKEHESSLINKKLIEDRDNIVILAHAQEFIANNRVYNIDRKLVNKKIPYKIQVFPCKMIENTLVVYRVDEKENSSFIPVIINTKIKYHNIMLSNKKKCVIHFPFIDEYQDGTFYYKTSDSKSKFPITEAFLGKDMIVFLPIQECISIYISDKYKKCYQIKIEE